MYIRCVKCSGLLAQKLNLSYSVKHVADGVNTKHTFQVESQWWVCNRQLFMCHFYVNSSPSSLNQISLTAPSSIFAQIAVIKVLIKAFHNDNVWIKCRRFSSSQMQQLLLDQNTYMDLNRTSARRKILFNNYRTICCVCVSDNNIYIYIIVLLKTHSDIIIIIRCPDDETCLLVSTPSKALSQSFENLLDDNSFGLVHVRN